MQRSNRFFLQRGADFSRQIVVRLQKTTFVLGVATTLTAFLFAPKISDAQRLDGSVERPTNSTSKPERSAPFGWAQGLSKIFEPAEKEGVATSSASETSVEGSSVSASVRRPAPRPLPIPESAGIVLRALSLNRLETGISTFFRQTGGDDFSFLAALRLAPVGDALSSIDLDAPVALVVFCETTPPTFALLLPVENFQEFVAALDPGATPDAVGRVRISRPVDAFAFPVAPGFVALTLPKNVDAATAFFAPNAPRRRTSLPAGLESPILSLETTPRGFLELTAPERPFWAQTAQAAAEALGPTVNFPIDENLNALRERVRANVLETRFDVASDDFGTYFSAQTASRPDSSAARRLAEFQPVSPVDLNADRFFYILPDVEAPISGQAELPPETVADLPAPFNRLRRIEYSLSLPRVGELAAESWLFYLEVDDAKAFVRELTVPNAKKIGRYVASKQAEEIGAEIFGNIAERRRQRQFDRRRPTRNPVDPQEAATRGAALGGLLGGLIGESAAEKEALKEYNFDGFTTYVSDLETYVRQSAIMRAEEQGKIPPKPIYLTGDRVLLSTAGDLISGIADGSLEDSLRDSVMARANENERFADPTPLFARRSTTVVLDDQHLLIGLGNENLLRVALKNWRAATDPNPNAPRRYATTVPDVDFGINLNRLFAQVPRSDEFNVLAAVRFDSASAQTFGAWLRQNYFPTLPDVAPRTLPADTPQTLWIASVSANREFVRGVVPNRTVENLSRTFCDDATPLQLLLKHILYSKESDVEEDAIEIDFDD